MNQLRNQVQLIGHLGRDPEVKHFANDKIVAKFPLATSETYRNEQGVKTTDTQWHNIVIWGKLAKVAEEYLQKGMQIAIKGKLTHRIYEDKDGMKRTITEIITFDLMMLSTGKKVEKFEKEEEFLPF
jgi:single-strand DNA-binding protein